MNTANTTIYVGGLNDRVTEEILYELFVQTGPINKVTLPKDRESGKQRAFAFIDYKHACSVPYTINVMNGISLFNRKLNVKAKSGSDNHDIGLGLLPHPQFGPGVLPADLSEFIKENREERYPSDYQPMPPNFMPGMPLPPMPHPGMMGMMGMMGAPPQMMMMPPGRTMNRSQTWHGDVNDIRRRDRDAHPRDRDRDAHARDRDRESDRRDRRDRESDRDSRDRSHDRHGQSRGRDRNSGSRRSHDDRKRDRSDSPMSYNSDRHVDKRSRQNNDGNYGNRGHYADNIKGNDIQMLAMMQMQMLQQQNRPYQNSPGPASHRRY